jgi:hypothetical protein
MIYHFGIERCKYISCSVAVNVRDICQIYILFLVVVAFENDHKSQK